jgi:hypothetical protein
MVRLGPWTVDPPVVLAPMAGITNVAFRRLCQEQGGGLFVCEMITTRALVERNPKTLRMIAFADGERPRSLQLYGVDPATVAAAVRMVVEENLADHIDMNFGCPVPKVTRKGGGAALPWRRRLFARIVTAAVTAAGHVPVTVKMRTGIDDEHLTYVEAGLIAQDAGVAAGRPPRADGSPALLGSGRLGGDRQTQGGAGRTSAWQRRYLGGWRRAADDAGDRVRRGRRRSRLPWSALALRRPGGSFPRIHSGHAATSGPG